MKAKVLLLIINFLMITSLNLKKAISIYILKFEGLIRKYGGEPIVQS